MNISFQSLRSLKQDYRSVFLILSALFFIIPQTAYGLSDLQFIYAAFMPVVVFVGFKVLKYDFWSSVIYNDSWLLLFIAFGFLSSIWAIDSSLVWYQGFGWMSYFFLMITFRKLFANEQIIKSFSSCLIGVFCTLAISQFCSFVYAGTWDEVSWHQAVGRNGNYTSCLLAILYPYVIFQKGSSIELKVIKVLGTILMLFILYVTTSKGIILSLPFIVLLWFRYNYPTQKHIANMLFCAGAFVWATSMVLMGTTDVMDDISGLGRSTRGYMLKASFRIFMEDPLTGAGMGNWFLKAYNYGIEEVRYFGNPYYWIRYHSHNIYGRLLAELGLVGLFSFVFFFGNVIREKLFKFKTLNHWEYAPMSSVILYLLFSFFYNAPTFSLHKFSGIQFVAFASLGLLTVNQINIHRKAMSMLILGMSIFITAWFIYGAYNNYYFHQAKRSIKQGDVNHGIELLESIYNPNWNAYQSYQVLLPFQIAKLASENGREDHATMYYEKAILKAPYNGELLFEYAKFLVENEGAFDKAEELLTRVVQLQSNRHAVNYLLAKVYNKKGEFALCKKYLDLIEGSTYESKGAGLLNLISDNLELKDEK